MLDLLSRRPVLQAIPTSFGGIVAPSGGDFSNIQDADDALGANPYTIYVKPGTYPGFTIATNNVYIMLGPAVTITGAITWSGDNGALHAGPGCTWAGLLTTSGLNVHVTIENGLAGVGILMSGNFGYLNGGGFDSLMDGGITRIGLVLSGTDCIAENISAQTTAGGGTGFDGIAVNGARGALYKVRMVDSDDIGISMNASDGLAFGVEILGADGRGLQIAAPRNRAEGNYIFEPGSDGIHVTGAGDNSVMQFNVVQDHGGSSILLAAGGDNCVAVHNRLDGVVSDGAAGSVVANNNTAAF